MGKVIFFKFCYKTKKKNEAVVGREGSGIKKGLLRDSIIFVFSILQIEMMLWETQRKLFAAMSLRR